jgi:hypothetical protein
MGGWGDGLLDNDGVLDVLADILRVDLDQSAAHLSVGLGIRVRFGETQDMLGSHTDSGSLLATLPSDQRKAVELAIRAPEDLVGPHRSEALRAVVGGYCDGPLVVTLFEVENASAVLAELKERCIRALDRAPSDVDEAMNCGSMAALAVLLHLRESMPKWLGRDLAVTGFDLTRWRRGFESAVARAWPDSLGAAASYERFIANVRKAFNLLGRGSAVYPRSLGGASYALLAGRDVRADDASWAAQALLECKPHSRRWTLCHRLIQAYFAVETEKLMGAEWAVEAAADVPQELVETALGALTSLMSGNEFVPPFAEATEVIGGAFKVALSRLGWDQLTKKQTYRKSFRLGIRNLLTAAAAGSSPTSRVLLREALRALPPHVVRAYEPLAGSLAARDLALRYRTEDVGLWESVLSSTGFPEATWWLRSNALNYPRKAQHRLLCDLSDPVAVAFRIEHALRFDGTYDAVIDRDDWSALERFVAGEDRLAKVAYMSEVRDVAVALLSQKPPPSEGVYWRVIENINSGNRLTDEALHTQLRLALTRLDRDELPLFEEERLEMRDRVDRLRIGDRDIMQAYCEDYCTEDGYYFFRENLLTTSKRRFEEVCENPELALVHRLTDRVVSTQGHVDLVLDERRGRGVYAYVDESRRVEALSDPIALREAAAHHAVEIRFAAWVALSHLPVSADTAALAAEQLLTCRGKDLYWSVLRDVISAHVSQRRVELGHRPWADVVADDVSDEMVNRAEATLASLLALPDALDSWRKVTLGELSGAFRAALARREMSRAMLRRDRTQRRQLIATITLLAKRPDGLGMLVLREVLDSLPADCRSGLYLGGLNGSESARDMALYYDKRDELVQTGFPVARWLLRSLGQPDVELDDPAFVARIIEYQDEFRPSALLRAPLPPDAVLALQKLVAGNDLLAPWPPSRGLASATQVRDTAEALLQA